MTLYSAVQMDGPAAGPTGGSTDTTPPVVTPVSPLPGGVLAASGAIGFTVTDLPSPTTFASLLVWVRFASGQVDMVHDGAAFTPAYAGLSTRAAIADGFSYSVRRNVGWPSGTIDITANAVDAGGNVG